MQVPGQPITNAQGVGIPPDALPSQWQLYMAAAIMHGQEKFQVAGDVVPFNRPLPRPGEAYESAQKGATRRILSRVLEMEPNVTPIKPEGK